MHHSGFANVVAETTAGLYRIAMAETALDGATLLVDPLEYSYA